jgi:hypothetical protein
MRRDRLFCRGSHFGMPRSSAAVWVEGLVILLR